MQLNCSKHIVFSASLFVWLWNHETAWNALPVEVFMKLGISLLFAFAPLTSLTPSTWKMNRLKATSRCGGMDTMSDSDRRTSGPTFTSGMEMRSLSWYHYTVKAIQYNKQEGEDAATSEIWIISLSRALLKNSPFQPAFQHFSNILLLHITDWKLKRFFLTRQWSL